jgi:hypothetical protein
MSCPNGTFCQERMCVPSACTGGSQGSACGLQGSNGVGVCCGFLSPQCTDIRNDSQNCGSCGLRCPSGSACVSGVCQSGGATCQRGDLGRFCNLDAGITSVCCPGAGCVDTSTNGAHCGACGNACGAGLNCLAGRCVASSCTAGTATRPCLGGDGGTGTCCGTSCADLPNDPLNCGQCGRLCALGETCQRGACAAASCSGTSPGVPCHLNPGIGSCCGTACVSTRFDPLNCGACNRQCPPGATCDSSMCR